MASSFMSYSLKNKSLAQDNPRYFWLSQYLNSDAAFLVQHLYPISQGSTRVLIADFPPGLETSAICSYVDSQNIEVLDDALAAPKGQVRVVFVTSVSGVGDQVRKKQLSNVAKYSNPLKESQEAQVPVLTRPRTAGSPGTHPIEGHRSFLPDPDVLDRVARAVNPDPEWLLRYLDHREHLSYSPRCLQRRGTARAETNWEELRILVNQANHLTVLIGSSEGTGSGRTKSDNASYTVLMLAAEDDCLGIDFNPETEGLDQMLRDSPGTVCATFEAALRSLTHEEYMKVLADPASLVWLYTGALTSAFSCHLDLYRRGWSTLCEPFANLSVTYGYAMHRENVRKLAKEYTLQLRYINSSLDNLRRLLARKTRIADRDLDTYLRTFLSSNVARLEDLVADFEHFSQELDSLKTTCDHFLEQQVNKMSLQEARMSMREARDLKRLSYLGFVFVPLSLSSSFFSMNVVELNGTSTPLWVFIVTAIAVLAFSTAVLVLSGSKATANMFKGLRHSRLIPVPPQQTEEYGHSNAIRVESYHHGLPLTNPPGPASPTKVEAPTSTIVLVTSPVSTVSQRDPRSRRKRTKQQRSSRKPPPNDEEQRQRRIKLSMQSPEDLMPFYRAEHADAPIGTMHAKNAKKQNTTLSHQEEDPTSQAVKGLASGIARMQPIPESPPPSSSSQARGGQESEADVESPQEDKGGLNPKSKDNRTDLHQASCDGDVDLVRGLLENGADIEVEDCKRRTPLQLAAKKGHEAVVRLLLQRGATPFPAGGPNTLALAAAKNRESILQILMNWLWPGGQSPKFNNIRHAFEHALGDVCIEGDAAAVKRLIQVAKAHSGDFDSAYSFALGAAVRSESEATVSSLLEAIVDLKAQRASINGALSLAVNLEYDAAPVARMLLEAGAEVSYRTPSGLGFAFEMLGLACQKGSVDTVRLLLQFGAAVNPVPPGAATPLALTAERGSEPLIRLLLDSGADVNGLGVLRGAALSGSIDLVRFLVKAGANVNVEHTSGRTTWLPGSSEPLGVAAAKGSEDIVRFLLEQGIDLSHVFDPKQGTKGVEALNVASRNGHEAVALLLVDHGVDILAQSPYVHPDQSRTTPPSHVSDAMKGAAAHGCVALMQRALAAGAVVDSFTLWDRTILYLAAQHGQPALVSMLLERGAYVHGRRGYMPILAAAGGRDAYDYSPGLIRPERRERIEPGQLEAARLLLDHGAAITAKDNRRQFTPLHEAAISGFCRVAALLLERGADIAVTCAGGGTPLHTAAEQGHDDMVQFLLERGADIEARTDDGEGPLHRAAREGHAAAVRRLLGCGAAIDSVDGERWTPIHRAAWNKHEDVVRLLAQKGADLEAETAGELSILDFVDVDNESLREYLVGRST